MNQLKSIKLFFLITTGFIMLSPCIFWNTNSQLKNCEYRTLAEFPKAKNAIEFIVGYTKYFNDHYGLRIQLVDWNARIRKSLFHASTKPNQVIIGKNNWLFYTSENDGVLNCITRKNHLTASDLKQFIKTIYFTDSILNARGIKYLKVVWPNKSSVYPELLPTRVKWLKNQELSKREQILEAKKSTEPQLPFLDLTPFFLAHKNDTPLYLRTDTHWNTWGAFLAYQELFKSLDLIPFPIEQFTKNHIAYVEGDLFRNAGLCNTKSAETIDYEIKYKKPTNITLENSEINASKCYVNHDIQDGKTIVVFRDSYSTFLEHFVTLHFKEAYFVNGYYRQEVIDLVKPDYVVDAKVERYF